MRVYQRVLIVFSALSLTELVLVVCLRQRHDAHHGSTGPLQSQQVEIKGASRHLSPSSPKRLLADNGEMASAGVEPASVRSPDHQNTPPIRGDASSEMQLTAPPTNLHAMLAMGREFALTGDVKVLQHVFGPGIARIIRTENAGLVNSLMQTLQDATEHALLRKTILEALMWTDEFLAPETQKTLFYLAVQLMQHDALPDLRATALHAVAIMMTALKKSAPLPEEDAERFSHLAMQFVAARDQPEKLRQAAIIELTALNPPALPSLLQSIVAAQKTEPVNLIRCAGVALADLQQTAALPEMISLLQKTPDQNLFLAYAIAQPDSDDGLAALVTNAARFEGACQPYIGRHLDRIETNLKNGDGEAFTTAVEAIQFLPELAQRRQLMEQVIGAAAMTPTEISQEAARALLTLVANEGTPADRKTLLALLGEDARWQNEWRQVQDRSRAQSGTIIGYS